MEDLIKSGLKSQQCPYYAARELIKSANFIVFNYLYLLDPQIASSMIKSFANSKDTIVVFDEAHNIDDVCIEAYSLKVNARVVNIAERNVHKISSKV